MNHLALFFFTVLSPHWGECLALKCGKFNVKNDTGLGKGPANVCMCVCVCVCVCKGGWVGGGGEKEEEMCGVEDGFLL